MTTIFLDESGDLGFFKKGSSKYFIVTVLATENKRHLEKIVKLIHSQLRKKVKVISGGILHSYKEKPSTRTKLLTKLSLSNCTIMTIILDKSKVYTRLHEEKHVLYNYVTNILLDRIIKKKLVTSLNDLTLVASKRETNKFINENFKAYLTSQMTTRGKGSFTIHIKTPSEEKALQAVDFVSWAIFRKTEHNDNIYYQIIKSKIIEENRLFS